MPHTPHEPGLGPPRRDELAWVVPVLEKALGDNSRIVRSCQAGELPTIFGLAEKSAAALVQDHPDREIAVVATLYSALGTLLLKVDPETNDREQIVGACGELGRLGAWLASSEPRTLIAARRLIVVATTILDARISAPESALARGPAADFLINSAKVLSK